MASGRRAPRGRAYSRGDLSIHDGFLRKLGKTPRRFTGATVAFGQRRTLAVVYQVGFPDLPQQVGRTEDDGNGDY